MSKSKQIAKLLKADISMTSDLAAIAKMLESKGRGGDTILAHITRKEAEMLKAMGGSGTVNPETGLLEFAPEDGSFDIGFGAGQTTPQDYYQVAPSPSNEQISQQYNFEPMPSAVQAQPVAAQGYQGPAVSQAEPAFAGTYPTGQTITQGPMAGTSVYGPTQYSQMDLNRMSLGEQPEAQVKAPAAPAEKSWYDKLTTQDMIRLGLAGGLGIIGQQQAKKGAQQASEAAAQQQALGAPYQQKGQELQRAAQAGELTPTGQQSLQALQAQLAQGVESRGGVGAAQAAAQVEAFRQKLLQDQYNYGLQVANIGDQYALGAIKTGLQADQALNQASANFYTNMAYIAAGIPMVTRGQNG